MEHLELRSAYMLAGSILQVALHEMLCGFLLYLWICPDAWQIKQLQGQCCGLQLQYWQAYASSQSGCRAIMDDRSRQATSASQRLQ